MNEFSILVDLNSLEILPKTGTRRQSVIDFIFSLKDHFAIEPDFEITDPETGRIYCGNEVAGFAVIWWVDGADKEIKVVEIEIAE